MEKIKRILALLGAMLLALLYLATLIFALLGEEYLNWLMAALAVTIFLPVILWIFAWLQKHKKGDDELDPLHNLRNR